MISLSTALTSGKYYLYVYTDFGDSIYEHSSNNNNSSRRSIYITAYPPVDFAMINVSNPDSGISGKTLNITYTVKNLGLGRSLSNSYNNVIYLSADSIWSPSTDIFVFRELLTTQLSHNASYSKSVSVTIPNGLSGNYYLLSVTDESNTNNDINMVNNSHARVDSLNKMKKIYIKLPLTPDFIITTLTAPCHRHSRSDHQRFMDS